MRMRPATAALVTATIMLLGSGSLVVPGSVALAAQLAGGGRQAAIQRAFAAAPGGRQRMIVSIRISTVAPAWAVVRWVAPPAAGRSGSRAVPLALRSSYYHRAGGSEQPGTPPAAVRADLDRHFRVAVVYSGSGSESIAYSQPYRSVCAGYGGFVDSESVTVSPMSWTMRYVVDLDSVRAAGRSSLGPVLVPAVSFAGGSTLAASERITRTFQDVGCNGTATTFSCTRTFHAGGPDAAGQLAWSPTGGLDVGVAMRSNASGSCGSANFTLGPSLWENGAATAHAPRLGLVGGRLPADPYAPVRVSWPGNSGPPQFDSSPCQGDTAVCQDTFRWTGTVRLVPVAGG